MSFEPVDPSFLPSFLDQKELLSLESTASEVFGSFLPAVTAGRADSPGSEEERLWLLGCQVTSFNGCFGSQSGSEFNPLVEQQTNAGF